MTEKDPNKLGSPESSARRDTARPGADQSGTERGAAFGEPDAPHIGDWLHFEQDGTVAVYTGKAEMGQNIRTSLAQAVAEELHLDVDSVWLVMADTDHTPFDMGTFGSMTTPHMASRLHKVAAAARELLLDRAAEHWGVNRDELEMAGGRISHPLTGRSVRIEELAGRRKLAEPYGDDAPVIPPEDWTVAGTSVPKADGRAMVTGQNPYTPDLTRPRMLIGKVLRPPAFGATLKSLDTSAAEAMPGVVVAHEGNFVGVAAPDRMAAVRALQAVKAEWDVPRQVSEDELFEYLRSHPTEPQGYHRFAGPQNVSTGSVESGQAQAARTLDQTYTVAYIAHAPLEARAALAVWEGDRVIIWTGSQRPFGVVSDVAMALGLDADQVRVVVPNTGAGYGGKHIGDAAIEAARLARAAGKPVRVTWTREEEFTWAYFRPAGVIDVKAGAAADGTLTAWEYHNYNSGPEAMRTPYEVPNQRVEFHWTDSPLRQGSYRALAATANHFARETAMDELAHAIEMDPLEFRLKNLRDPRLRAVFEAAAERFGWGQQTAAAGHGFGIAGGTEKGSYVATCVEVAVDRASGDVTVVRAVEAFECGAIVNPDNLQNQVEGAMIMGLGGALFEAIHFRDGAIVNNRFSKYRVPRFEDVPAIETVLIDRKDLPPAGAGETPIVGIAPAIGNAIFEATGVRLRSMPLVPDGLK